MSAEQVAEAKAGAYLALLTAALDAVTQYTKATGRLGFHDLAMLETVRGHKGLAVPVTEAMARIIDHGEAVYIGGPKGTGIWDGVDEDTDEVLTRLGLIRPDFDREADDA